MTRISLTLAAALLASPALAQTAPTQPAPDAPAQVCLSNACSTAPQSTAPAQPAAPAPTAVPPQAQALIDSLRGPEGGSITDRLAAQGFIEQGVEVDAEGNTTRRFTGPNGQQAVIRQGTRVGPVDGGGEAVTNTVIMRRAQPPTP